MNKIYFIIKDSIKSLVKSWRMNIVFVCTLFGAMILAIYCLSSIRFLQVDLKNGRYAGIDQSIETGFIGRLLLPEEKENIVQKCQVDKSSIAAREKLYFPSLDNKSYFVLAIDNSFQDYEQINVKEGKLFGFQIGRYECVLGEKLAKEQRLSVDDSVSIAGISFRITGITAQGQYKKYVILPYQAFAKLVQTRQIQQTLYLTGGEVKTEKMKEILGSMESSEFLYSEAAETIYQQNKATTNRWIHIRELAGTVSLLFATFNILAVCFGKIQECRKKWLIKKMLGLSDLEVFLSFFTENLCVILAADFLAFLSFYPLTSLVGIRDVILVDKTIFIQTGFLSIVLAFIYALVLVAYLSHCPMSETLREGE